MKKDQAQLIKGRLWVHFGDRTFSIDANPNRKSRKKSAGGSSDKIMAPMPGKITKLMLKAGDPVQAGQAVVMMEAMKMEYTLKSDLTGTIDSISCAVGEQVVLGKLLVKLKL